MALRFTSADHGAERQHLDRLDAAKFERGFAYFVDAGHVVNPAEIPRRRIHRHQ